MEKDLGHGDVTPPEISPISQGDKRFARSELSIFEGSSHIWDGVFVVFRIIRILLSGSCYN